MFILNNFNTCFRHIASYSKCQLLGGCISLAVHGEARVLGRQSLFIVKPCSLKRSLLCSNAVALLLDKYRNSEWSVWTLAQHENSWLWKKLILCFIPLEITLWEIRRTITRSGCCLKKEGACRTQVLLFGCVHSKLLCRGIVITEQSLK